MRPSSATVFRALSVEAVSDAVRRRIVPVIAVVSLLSLTVIDSCTGCVPQVDLQGQELPDVQGLSGLLIVTVLGLWTMVLAGVLAADHLTETLENGAARLVLARPVSRGAFALSRLVGALAITFVTGAVLIGTAAFLLGQRQELPLGPALWAGLGCAAGASVVAALAMTVSLALPRIATTLLVLLAIAGIATLNGLSLSGVELEGLSSWIDRIGPPLASALAVPLEPWLETRTLPAEPREVALRLAFWVLGSGALLVVAFRRIDIDA